MKKIILITFFITIGVYSQAQIPDSLLRKVLTAINTQKTANTKDILTTFFRAGIDNLLGKEHSFTLNSSFYGIDSIFRGKNAVKPDFVRERKLRQKTLNISIEGDSVNNITALSGSMTVALVNRKDITIRSMDSADLKFLKDKSSLVSIVRKAALSVLAAKYPAVYSDSLRVIQKSWTDATKAEDFSKLHPYIMLVLNSPDLASMALADTTNFYSQEQIEEAKNSLLKGENPLNKAFKAMCEKYSRKALWTITPNLTYDRKNDQGEYSLSTEFSVGLGTNLQRKPWELEIKSQFKIGADSTVKKTNYDNKPFFISLGVNKVVMEAEDSNEPKMEFKLFTQYDHQFGTVVPGAKAGVFTLNSTFRVKVFKSLWLPLTLKYDPENNNFLGLFSITANLGEND